MPAWIANSLPSMRKPGLEPGCLITETADPKSASRPSTTLAPLSDHTTGYHQTTPDSTRRITPGVTRAPIIRTARALYPPRVCEVRACRSSYIPCAPNQRRCNRCVELRRFNPRGVR